MRKPNYGFEKRRKEEEKRRKQDAKRARKLEQRESNQPADADPDAPVAEQPSEGDATAG